MDISNNSNVLLKSSVISVSSVVSIIFSSTDI